jgi:hypothetical protein
MELSHDTFDAHINEPLWPAGGAGLATQVHTQETLERLGTTHTYRDFLVSGCKQSIDRHREILAQMTDKSAANRLRAYDLCRTSAWFMQNKISGQVRVASSRCGLRWCPLCQRTKRYIITAAVSAWLKTIKQPKFLTLTVKHSNDTLTQQIDKLYKWWKELKRCTWWRKRVSGGVWFFQVKISAADGLYHPHLHILFNGKFLPHEDLKAIWKRITLESEVVDIRAVKNPKKAAEYVARYAACPCELSKIEDARAYEIVSALHNRRIHGTFGSGKMVKFTSKPPDDADDWIKLDSYETIIRQKSFCSDSDEIFRCWRSGERCKIPLPEPPPVIAVDWNQKLAELETFKTAKQQLLF